MRALNVCFIVLFLLSAALQYNDPDPYIWIPIYLYGAFLCYQALKGSYNKPLYLAGLLVYGTYAVYLFFDKTGVWSWASVHKAENIVQSMKAEKPWIEETREFLGLLLLMTALMANMIWFRRRARAADSAHS